MFEDGMKFSGLEQSTSGAVMGRYVAVVLMLVAGIDDGRAGLSLGGLAVAETEGRGVSSTKTVTTAGWPHCSSLWVELLISEACAIEQTA